MFGSGSGNKANWAELEELETRCLLVSKLVAWLRAGRGGSW